MFHTCLLLLPLMLCLRRRLSQQCEWKIGSLPIVFPSTIAIHRRRRSLLMCFFLCVHLTYPSSAWYKPYLEALLGRGFSFPNFAPTLRRRRSLQLSEWKTGRSSHHLPIRNRKNRTEHLPKHRMEDWKLFPSSSHQRAYKSNGIPCQTSNGRLQDLPIIFPSPS